MDRHASPALNALSVARYCRTTRLARVRRRQKSRRPTKLVFLGRALVGLVGALDAILECATLRWEKLSDLIDARNAPAAVVVDQLADLELMTNHSSALRAFNAARSGSIAAGHRLQGMRQAGLGQ
jgi:hypothetical protein